MANSTMFLGERYIRQSELCFSVELIFRSGQSPRTWPGIGRCQKRRNTVICLRHWPRPCPDALTRISIIQRNLVYLERQMATIIPERPTTASAGERTLLRLLALLPDDCVVYHEPVVDGRHPDFVVIIPQLGVLVIEVKGWYAAKLRRLDTDSIERELDGRVIAERSPEKQVRDYLFRLMKEARRHRWAERLLHHEGEHRGRFRFPFAPLVVLPNITFNALQTHGIDLATWERVFPRDRTLLKEDLRTIASLPGERLVDALRPHIQPSWTFPPLNDPEVKALRAIIHPEIRLGDHIDIKALDSLPHAIDEQEDVVQVLDLRQEEHAQALGEGHRIVYGVAGSGKTVLLVARAKRLAENGGHRVFVTCYNRALAAWLRAELHEFPNVTVSSFHVWAAGFGIRWEAGQTDERLGERLLERLKAQPISQGAPWDAILVDEAQDFEPNWFRCLLAAMADPENGDLLIVADGCQSLYRRGKVNWSQLGIKARGRTISVNYQLDRNYRNSREIVAVAESFAHWSSDRDDLNAIQAVRVGIDRCERSAGVHPLLIQCESRRAELLEAYRIAQNLLSGSWQGRPVGVHRPGEISILYPGANEEEKERLAKFVEWMNAQGTPATWIGQSWSERDRIAGDQVKIQTIHSSKGLQFRAVILIWADKLPYPQSTPEEQLAQRRLLYVAMTRAVNLLAITASALRGFVREISETPTIHTAHAEGRPRSSTTV